MDASALDRVRGALWGLLIADALAMPVHWFYDPADIRKQFGRITGYQAPNATHPSSIMSLSNTGGHGRGAQEGRIIGDVINHGKRDFWAKPNTHYHQGMHAGDNTLNALCARVAMRSISRCNGRYDPAEWTQDYVAFMTTPGTHNDTYAESYHRDFFANYAKGVPPTQCAKGTEGHNTAQIGAFVGLPPVIAAALHHGGSGAATSAALSHLRTTHDSPKLEGKAQQYTTALSSLLQGKRMGDALIAAGLQLHVHPEMDDAQAVYAKYGPACYIDSSLPVVAHFVSKYQNDFEGGVLANANVGGENCHRGATIGALIGAHVGEQNIPERLKSGLHASEQIKTEIDEFVVSVQSNP